MLFSLDLKTLAFYTIPFHYTLSCCFWMQERIMRQQPLQKKKKPRIKIITTLTSLLKMTINLT